MRKSFGRGMDKVVSTGAVMRCSLVLASLGTTTKLGNCQLVLVSYSSNTGSYSNRDHSHMYR